MTAVRKIIAFGRALWEDQGGATTMEMALLIAAVILPAAYIIDLTVSTLVGHYHMITLINSLPFP